MNGTSNDLGEDAKEVLARHLTVGREKPVSYLPIKTVESIIGITVSAYQSMIEESGNRCIVFRADECCIKSGAVYAYSEHDLRDVLNSNQKILSDHGWSSDPHSFITRIAAEWIHEESSLMPVIKAAFDD